MESVPTRSSTGASLDGKPGLLAQAAIAVLRGYQRVLSPLLAVLFRSSCRFYPSCSEYAVQAVARYGVFRGTYMALGRILRCHPFHPGGHDPLPL